MLAGELVGHSSINKIQWGQQACAHLHLWRSELRRAGIGTEFFRRSVSVYFSRFGLRVVAVEPHAENPAPNRVLKRLEFRFIRRYRVRPWTFQFRTRCEPLRGGSANLGSAECEHRRAGVHGYRRRADVLACE
jgi:RimJ/RimL family protein N-acetyltransferase